MVALTAEQIATLSQTECHVHPLVLLSIVDHHSRAARGSKKRVVGCLLGQDNGKVINVANSFAVPFEEDEKDPKTWFLDHDFVESMAAMFRKVNAREKLIGFYHSGPSLRASDLEINELFKRYTTRPVMVVVDVGSQNLDELAADESVPAEAYLQVEEVREDGTPPAKTFLHIPSQIVAEEAEEIGVEHLLRDVRPTSASNASFSLLGGQTLATRISTLLASLRGLASRLTLISQYLDQVRAGTLPVNHAILYDLQEISDLLPGAELQSDEMVKAVAREGNDMMLVVFLSSLVRAVVKLHDLVDNKLTNSRAELRLDAEPAAAEGEKKKGEEKKSEGEGKKE